MAEAAANPDWFMKPQGKRGPEAGQGSSQKDTKLAKLQKEVISNQEGAGSALAALITILCRLALHNSR
eukprot:1212814-Pyramimonas_sp.AAC.1